MKYPSVIEEGFQLLLNIFLPYNLPTESVILIISILQTVGSWVRPGGIGALFLTLVPNYD